MNLHFAGDKAKKAGQVRARSRKELVRERFDQEGDKAALAQARKLKIKDSSARSWISRWRNESKPRPVSHIGIRDLQKLSADTIRALPGPTAVKSAERTVALLVPLKASNPDRLAAVLSRAAALAKGRDAAADDAALAPFGVVDPVDWSVEAVRALMAGARKA
ncbi:MAG TPA: hypothetical protein VGC36_09675 [Rhizomicrobium sp.]